jgi:hypothetical protein
MVRMTLVVPKAGQLTLEQGAKCHLRPDADADSPLSGTAIESPAVGVRPGNVMAINRCAVILESRAPNTHVTYTLDVTDTCSSRSGPLTTPRPLEHSVRQWAPDGLRSLLQAVLRPEQGRPCDVLGARRVAPGIRPARSVGAAAPVIIDVPEPRGRTSQARHGVPGAEVRPALCIRSFCGRKPKLLRGCTMPSASLWN